MMDVLGNIFLYIFAAMVLSIPVGVIVIFCLALKVAYDIRKRNLLERYLCIYVIPRVKESLVFNPFPQISKYIHRPWCASLLGQPENTPECDCLPLNRRNAEIKDN